MAAIALLGAEGMLTDSEPSQLQVELLGAVAVLTASSPQKMTVEVIANWLRRIFAKNVTFAPGQS